MKNYIGIIKLLCILVLLPVVVWRFGLNNTFRLYNENKKLEILHNKAINNQGVAGATFPTQSVPLLSNGKILQLFSDSLITYGVEFVRYTPHIIDSENDYKLYCGELLLTGGYISLVKVVSLIEKANLPLKIVSMNFEYDTRRNRQIEKQLVLTLLFEQIE